MKTCKKCGVEKPLDCFTKDKNQKDGLMRWCKPCRAEHKKASYERNRGKILAKQKAYREANKEKVSETKKQSRLKKIDQYLQRNRDRYYANREEILAKTKEKRLANLDESKRRERETYQRRKDAAVERQKQYYRETKSERLKYYAKYQKERAKSDPVYALGKLVRRRISLALSKGGYQKESRTQEMLGCDYEYLKRHLEKQFLKGMSWENRGSGWHIDHIVPLASAKTKEEVIALCHFTNLRPMWALENISKGAKQVSLL